MLLYVLQFLMIMMVVVVVAAIVVCSYFNLIWQPAM
jgi:hypothetical protein